MIIIKYINYINIYIYRWEKKEKKNWIIQSILNIKNTKIIYLIFFFNTS
jgi:hypothetical protein